MAFTDQDKIPEEAKRAVAFLTGNLHCISGYEDGAFHPERHMKRGEFCKMLLNSVMGREIYIDLKEMTGAGEWKEAIDSWAGRYILFFRTVISEAKEKERYKKRASMLLERYFDGVGVITKKEAFEWSQMFFETEFSFQCQLNCKDVDDTPADRAGLCQLIYAIFEKAAEYFYQNPKKLKKLLMGGVPCTKGERPELHFLCLDSRVAKEGKCFEGMLKTGKSQDRGHPIWTGSAFQYTSLSAVYKMLQAPKKKEPVAEQATREAVDNYPTVKLWLSNTAYLNDPNEGALFREIMNSKGLRKLKKYFNEENLSRETEIDTSEVYVASLSRDEEERLPMWVQYGDWGRGCRIEFEVSERDGFRKLMYYDKLPLKKARKYIIGQSSFAVKVFLVDILKKHMRKNAFLYKAKYYKHEKEVRILRIASVKDKDIKEETENIRDGEVFPRMHLESYHCMKILSITLGPRCENPEHVALALKKLGVPVVKKSKIQFR